MTTIKKNRTSRVKSELPRSRRPHSQSVPSDALGDERGRRERNKLEKRDRIRQAAWELLIERGFADTTTRAVADRAGVGTGTLFLYAADKADLLFLVMHDRLAEASDRAFATLPHRAPLIDQLLHLFGALYRMYGEQPSTLAVDFIRLLPGARGGNADRVNALTFAFMSRLAALLRDGQARGEVLPNVPLQAAASNLFASYFMLLLAWAAGMMMLPTEKDPALRELLQVQLTGIAPR